ncbi:MAG: hypothetical protein R3Y58_02025 [Eubacteriales bacterium]
MAEEKKKKSVGGVVSEELYWAFKATQAARQESSTKALEEAIRLYIDIPAMDNGMPKPVDVGTYIQSKHASDTNLNTMQKGEE